MQVYARIRRFFTVVLGALMMLWPALCNGYPLLYPDSMTYLNDGRPLAKILFLHAPRGFTGMRSEFYSLGIFFFHWNFSAWPIIAMQALVTSYIIWLVVRSLAARLVELQFLSLVAVVSLTTSLGWYVSFVMPDILGAVLYLAIYLLVFARETLSTREIGAVAAISCWAMASHTTHWMLAVILCALLGLLLLLLRWTPMRECKRGLAWLAALILLVAGSQMALHKYLYGAATLNGNRMPYLTARIIADGPGSWYLQQHCGELQWAICARVDTLPDTDDSFLWDDDGIWQTSSGDEQERMLREEMPLVVATLRAYPREQSERSLANFREEIDNFALRDFCPNTWMEGEIDRLLPGVHAKYLRTRQAHLTLPNDFFTRVQLWVVSASALGILCTVPFLLWLRRGRILGLAAIIVPVVLANAFITAVLSEVDSRYQSRVIWLIPLLAGLIALDLFNRPNLSGARGFLSRSRGR